MRTVGKRRVGIHFAKAKQSAEGEKVECFVLLQQNGIPEAGC